MMTAAGIALLVLALVFAGAWLFARRVDNYGVVDVVWSYSFALATLIYAWALESWSWTALALMGMVAIWSGRLGTHLLLRVKDTHPREDLRYEVLRQDWRDRFDTKMFLFFQAQAASVALLSLPFLLVLRDPPASLGLAGIGGLAFWAVGLIGESVADRQLSRFKKQQSREDRQAVCREGLWRYSRHPNYFFEWLIWVGFAIFALESDWGLLALLSPVIIYVLITRVSGIPPTEAAAVRSKGDQYLHYQKTTNAFFPWPPRSV